MYTLTITYSTRLVDKLTPGTFGELSSAIDAAMASPGFTRYEVGSAGDR